MPKLLPKESSVYLAQHAEDRADVGEKKSERDVLKEEIQCFKRIIVEGWKRLAKESKGKEYEDVYVENLTEALEGDPSYVTQEVVERAVRDVLLIDEYNKEQVMPNLSKQDWLELLNELKQVSRPNLRVLQGGKA